MKHFNLSKIVGASILAASLTVMPLSLSASAQTNSPPNTTTEDTSRPTIDTTPFQETNDGNNNWGWLGLVGLLGLLNLLRKPKQPVHQSEPDTINRSSSKF